MKKSKKSAKKKPQAKKPLPPMPASTDIPLDDRIRQTDAAKLLGVSRQRVFERVRKGSLSHAKHVDALGRETLFVSLKEVRYLKAESDKKVAA